MSSFSFFLSFSVAMTVGNYESVTVAKWEKENITTKQHALKKKQLVNKEIKGNKTVTI